MPWIETTPDGLRLHLRVTPRAARSEVAGLHGDRLKIRLQAPPVDGKANRALLRFLADRLGLPAARLQLAAGAKGREKTVMVRGIPEADARTLLQDRREETTRDTHRSKRE